jgi:hypothetical protein
LSPVNLPATVAVVTPQSLRPLRDGFDTPRTRADEGLVADDSVLRRYTAPWLPMVLGGWSAFTTLLLVDHMRQSISMVMAHRPGFNEFRQLTRGMVIAIFGRPATVSGRCITWPCTTEGHQVAAGMPQSSRPVLSVRLRPAKPQPRGAASTPSSRPGNRASRSSRRRVLTLDVPTGRWWMTPDSRSTR